MTRSVPRPIYILLGFMMNKGEKRAKEAKGCKVPFRAILSTEGRPRWAIR
jgi:hypothetical protein